MQEFKVALSRAHLSVPFIAGGARVVPVGFPPPPPAAPAAPASPLRTRAVASGSRRLGWPPPAARRQWRRGCGRRAGRGRRRPRREVGRCAVAAGHRGGWGQEMRSEGMTRGGGLKQACSWVGTASLAQLGKARSIVKPVGRKGEVEPCGQGVGAAGRHTARRREAQQGF
eukprot:scaffold6532_cov116-Isochrysis_galbana.AAC.20